MPARALAVASLNVYGHADGLVVHQDIGGTVCGEPAPFRFGQQHAPAERVVLKHLPHNGLCLGLFSNWCGHLRLQRVEEGRHDGALARNENQQADEEQHDKDGREPEELARP